MRRAFTMIEVLLALGLLAGLTAGVSSFVYSMTQSRRTVEKATDEEMVLSTFMDQLESDLTSVVAGGGPGVPGVVGTADSLSLISRRVGIPTDPAMGEAASRGQLSDLRRTEYTFGSTLSARRHIGLDGPVDSANAAVGAVQLRYYDGTQWAPTFSSATAGGLPIAIEVRVWRASAGEVTFTDGKASRQPDRVRVIAVPDGPVASWKGGAA